ncbi:MAG: hypothetical protein QG650_977 [Patescibacteria group bacterium]|nr:hypothetical protein [Patescibacteria group bacterium]
MSSSDSERLGHVSGASKEVIFAAYYHSHPLPLNIGEQEVQARVARIRGTTDPGVYEIAFRVEPKEKGRHVIVPRYDTADAKGGMGTGIGKKGLPS